MAGRKSLVENGALMPSLSVYCGSSRAGMTKTLPLTIALNDGGVI